MLRAEPKLLSGLTLAMSFVAALVLAVLPMGLMPKVAGSCGRALCRCVETTPKKCSICPITQEPVKAKPRWVLVDSQMHDSLPGLAYNPVLSELGLVQAPEYSLSAQVSELSSAIDHSAYSHDSLARDIHAPPPRA